MNKEDRVGGLKTALITPMPELREMAANPAVTDVAPLVQELMLMRVTVASLSKVGASLARMLARAGVPMPSPDAAIMVMHVLASGDTQSAAFEAGMTDEEKAGILERINGDPDVAAITAQLPA